MRRKLFFWELGGFLFTGALGTLLHFVYEWSGGSALAAWFSAVNESTWEHMKLLFVPLFLFSVAQVCLLGRNYPNLLAVRALSTLTGAALIPVLFYTYTGILGYHITWVNISIFFAADLAAFALDFALLRRGRLSSRWMQLLGLVEISYLEGISPEKRAAVFDTLFSYHTPAVIFARGLKPYPECMEMAKKHDQVILSTQENTANIMSTMIAYLRTALSPTITRHGVLMEVYGEGVLLAGESGVGKSETAIELVKRGHRLIADDAVEIRRDPKGGLVGTAPELIRHYIELRGIGVVDVQRLFGMSAVKFDSAIDMMIELETWQDGKLYDRLGADEHFTTLLDVRIPTLLIPVKPGRNLAVIIEVAAMNNRNKKMGYNDALEFSRQVDSHIDRQYLELNPQ